MLLALAGGWALAGEDPAGGAEYVLVGVAGLAMGLQSAAVRQLRVGGVATTYVTGTLTGLLADLALGAPRAARCCGRAGCCWPWWPAPWPARWWSVWPTAWRP